MRRQCSRNLHQTIAVSLVSSGSITCTETIEPEEASIFGIAVRQRRSAAAAICLSALRSPRLARGFFVGFIPAGQQIEFWLRGGGGPVAVCSRRSVAVHVPRFSVRPLHEYPKARVRRAKRRERNNAQVDCCCWLCRSRRNFGASNNARDATSAGWHDHASSLGMRPRQNAS